MKGDWWQPRAKLTCGCQKEGWGYKPQFELY